MHQLIYSESQRMPAGMFILGGIVVLFVVIVFKAKIKTKVARVLSVAALVVACVLFSIMATLRLETKYYTDRLEYQFGSLYMERPEIVSMDTVTSVSIITYNPSDYGGWGMKGNETTRVYNASGDKGILFTFKRGKKLLLGTQQPDVLKTKLTGHYPLTN